jgi:hypothetical protein
MSVGNNALVDGHFRVESVMSTGRGTGFHVESAR